MTRHVQLYSWLHGACADSIAFVTIRNVKPTDRSYIAWPACWYHICGAYFWEHILQECDSKKQTRQNRTNDILQREDTLTLRFVFVIRQRRSSRNNAPAADVQERIRINHRDSESMTEARRGSTNDGRAFFAWTKTSNAAGRAACDNSNMIELAAPPQSNFAILTPKQMFASPWILSQYHGSNN